MNKLTVIPAALLLLFAAGVTWAQTATPTPTVPPGEAGSAPRTVVRSDAGTAPVIPAMIEPLTTGGLLDSLLVINFPFSAVFESETVQPGANSATATTRVTTRLARDLAGRTRREQIFYAAGVTPSANDVAESVSIYDPVTRWKYSLNTTKRIAERYKLPVTLPTGALLDAVTPINTRIYRQENSSTGAATTYTLAAPTVLPLGVQTIAGVLATGTRTTWRIPAGALGNPAPADAAYETWFALDLQLLVKCTVVSPAGSHTLLLKSLSRTAPAASLFEVPADYTMSEMGTVRTDLPPPR